ncbi:hypothetical protein [uncultured Cobetia sp.]|uniref:hypothetical protein n=1 Tax=uncultured Cobetia sp. TaxID=410706 RepID=UPI000E85293C|nr:hypothetical protein [Cobetia sp.]
MIEEIVIGIAMAVLGHLVHLLKRVVETRADGQGIGLVAYVKGRRYRTALGMAGSAVAMGFMIDSGQVTAMGAFAAGYMADSGLAMLGKRERRS